MEKQPYEFLGFNLQKIQFEKDQTEKLTELRISVSSFYYDEESYIFSICICIELDYDISKENVLSYVSGFKIEDSEVRNDVASEEKAEEYLPIFMSIVLPYIRSSITAITVDAGNVVILPTINCRMINMKETLVVSVRKD